MTLLNTSPGEPGTGRKDGEGSKPGHTVGCIYCREVFDLLQAVWCEHRSIHPSKICPQCRRCLCAHPMYGWLHLWHDPPPNLRLHGFRKVFVLYTEYVS